jgi:predicted O-methyltransferase YrrM
VPDDLNSWISALLGDADLMKMGHAQGGADNNLGLGWLYYGLARILHPATVVVIGSYRGFVPMVFGRALADNGDGGQVHFLDPSMVDDFWKDGARVEAYFVSHGLRNIRHYLATTQQFVAASAFGELQSIGIVFIDGYHTEEQARFDYEAFHGRLSSNAFVLLHDSMRERTSRIYGEDRAYVHSVKRFVDTLKRNPGLQVLDLPFGDGLTLVRSATLLA